MTGPTLVPLEAIKSEPYEEAFLIGDMVTTKITILAGAPKAGKSMLAAGIVAALFSDQPEFLGQPIIRRPRSVVWAWTDDGADSELRERLWGQVPEGSVRTLRIDSAQTSCNDYWSAMYGLVSDGDLLVVDNALGVLGTGEDIANSTAASGVMARLRPFSASGVPVILVTHTPKGNVEGLDVASSPIGGRAFAAGARGIVRLAKSKDRGLRLETSINRAKADLDLQVALTTVAGSEVPVWSLRSGQGRAELPKRERSRERRDRWKVLRRRVVEENPQVTNLSALGKWYAQEKGQASANTIRQRLSGLVEHDGRRWRLVEKASEAA